jgi:hypothetical protein
MLPTPHSRINMIKYRILLLPLLLGLSYAAFAQQVYKSTDAEGNVTYSDAPSTSSEEVQVEETNVADPVEVPANTTPAPAPEPEVTQQKAPPQPTAETHDDEYYDDIRRGRGARTLRRHHRFDHRRR